MNWQEVVRSARQALLACRLKARVYQHRYKLALSRRDTPLPFGLEEYCDVMARNLFELAARAPQPYASEIEQLAWEFTRLKQQLIDLALKVAGGE